MLAGFLYVLVIGWNLGISVWNARICGICWTDSKVVGGYVRALVWCGATQSAIGFSMAIAFVIGSVLRALNHIPTEAEHWISSLWYLIVIIPAVGTGFLIMINSWVALAQDRTVYAAARAGYNTFAEIYDLVTMPSRITKAVHELGTVFRNPPASGGGDWSGTSGSGETSSSSSSGGKTSYLLILVVLVVAVSLLGGVLITALIIQAYDKPENSVSAKLRREAPWGLSPPNPSPEIPSEPRRAKQLV